MEARASVHMTSQSVEAVYREHRERLWRSLLAFAGDPAIAEDAIAEAFAQALRRGDAIRDLERWVWRAAYRIAAGSLKERSRISSDVPERAYELPDVPYELADALAKLPDGQRAAVILHYYADLRVRDVAAVMGTTPAAVKVSLMRARRRLRKILEDPDV